MNEGVLDEGETEVKEGEEVLEGETEEIEDFADDEDYIEDEDEEVIRKAREYDPNDPFQRMRRVPPYPYRVRDDFGGGLFDDLEFRGRYERPEDDKDFDESEDYRERRRQAVELGKEEEDKDEDVNQTVFDNDYEEDEMTRGEEFELEASDAQDTLIQQENEGNGNSQKNKEATNSEQNGNGEGGEIQAQSENGDKTQKEPKQSGSQE